MRVALLTHQWPGIRMGGIGAAVRQTAAALAAAGHEVHLFTFEIPPDLAASIPAGVHFHQVPSLAVRVSNNSLNPLLVATIDSAGEGAYRLALASLLCESLLREHAQTPFDIIEAPEVDALALPLLLKADFTTPVITHLHCCTALANFANQQVSTPSQSLTTSLEFASIHLAHALCAPTGAVMAATRRFVPIARDVAIIPHPFNATSAPFVPPPADGPIAFIGRIERLKGVETIAAALRHFLPRNSTATFRFIGPDTPTAPAGGSMQQFLQSQFPSDLAPRIHFTSELSPVQIQRELAAASFCVQPSFWENFSMTCCEAFAAGRTVIVGKDTGSVELIGNAGISIDPASPAALATTMEELWKDRKRLNHLSAAAHRRIRTEFAPPAIAAKRVAFYQQVINDFRARESDGLADKLATLPPSVTASLLPALSTLIGTLAGAKSTTSSPGQQLLSIMQILARKTGAPAQILLYGAGKFTARLLAQRSLWETKGHRVIGLIDDHPRFAEKPAFLGLPVRSLKKVIHDLADHPPQAIVLSTDTYQGQFWTQTKPLRDKNITVIRLDQSH
jgi:glycosyltransferase involved in cell wall biosynthesis